MSSRSPVVHRIVEYHAARGGEAVAVCAGTRVLTRRELNQQANVAARRLMTAGFRRGDLADVWMPAGTDLAVVLLAVLKAGGCYYWTPRARRAGDTPHVRVHSGSDAGSASIVPVRDLLPGSRESSPNLPVLVRGSDAACILRQEAAAPVLVPHATLVALQRTRTTQPVGWSVEPGAFDLLILLMAGVPAAMAPVVDPPRTGERERRGRSAGRIGGLHDGVGRVREGDELSRWRPQVATAMAIAAALDRPGADTRPPR